MLISGDWGCVPVQGTHNTHLDVRHAPVPSVNCNGHLFEPRAGILAAWVVPLHDAVIRTQLGMSWHRLGRSLDDPEDVLAIDCLETDRDRIEALLALCGVSHTRTCSCTTLFVAVLPICRGKIKEFECDCHLKVKRPVSRQVSHGTKEATFEDIELRCRCGCNLGYTLMACASSCTCHIR